MIEIVKIDLDKNFIIHLKTDISSREHEIIKNKKNKKIKNVSA